MILRALPFLISFLTLPFLLLGMVYGGIWIPISMVVSLLGAPMVDALTSLDTENLDPNMDENQLIWHRLVTWIWLPAQLALIVTLICIVGMTDWLTTSEALWSAVSLGILTGGIGITFAHELMHQKSKFERRLAEITVCSTLYGHFCIEHIFGHHIRVATPEDPASAQRGQSLYVFLPNSLIKGFLSAWEIQCSQLQRRGKKLWDLSNAFWRYGAWTVFWFTVSYWIAGWVGMAVFLVQSFVAVCLLETVNYVEHYGLQRRKGPNGKYEPVQPHHSWNANHRATNYLLINLQRHSDHHYKPARRFPLLQAYSEDDAPQLPLSYPLMIGAAFIPPLWFSVMNPRLDSWQEKYYQVDKINVA